MKGMFRILFAMMAVVAFMTACDVMEEPYLQGAEDEKAIIQFDVDSIVGVIDESSKTVTLDFPGGADVTNLTPFIKVSTYATIDPASGVAQDFSEPVYYTVTAFNGSSVQYRVDAVVHDADNEKNILSFRIEEPAVEGVINEIAKTVMLEFPAGTDVTHLVPVIEISEGATIDPASGVAQDFSVPVGYTVTAQNGTTAVYTVMATVESDVIEPTGKTVLIKDFTGARCVNCPAAADYAHNLQHQLDEEHIFILSVHAGSLAQPVGQFPNFVTDEGTAWYNNEGSNPLFSVNRVALTEGNALYVEQIDTPVAAALAEEQTFEIVVNTVYDEATRQLGVTARMIALADLDGDYNVTVCLVEDHIVGRQVIVGGVDTEYVFRNVFRGTLNGAEGENFSNGSLQAEEQHLVQYTTELNADYNADECYVLVYVHDRTQDGKIMQSALRKIN